MKFNKNPLELSVYIFFILFFLALPYFLFQGKLFIGGDDTRLLYAYPYEFLSNISFYSWYNFSSFGTFNPNQFSLPFTLSWSILYSIFPSRTFIDYLAFSLPLILGFIYFQKFANIIIEEKGFRLEIFVGALVYTMSPILLQNQLSIFLYAAWLVALLPIIGYYLLQYIQTGKMTNILKCVLFCIWLSLALFSIPWLLGFVIPVLLGLIILSIFYERKKSWLFLKRSFVFFGFLIASQSFWLFPFVSTFIKAGSNSYGGQILSDQTSNTFVSTVLTTATGTPLLPLMNLFHRQIAFDYNWGLMSVYQSYYDKILLISGAYLIVLFVGIIVAKQVLDRERVKRFAGLLIMLTVSLFLFTVNIGPLKSVFISLHVLPGIAMFRNFYDKFALGYALLFALTITFSLIILAKKFPKYRQLINGILIGVVIINFIPVKDTIVRPIWGTTNIFTNITIPDEYMQFMDHVSQTVPATSNIVSLPYNIAAYTIIKDTNSQNIFSGTSPVKIFSGRNDFSGDLSFSSSEAGDVRDAISEKDDKKLLNIFEKNNISYVFVTKNIPTEVKKSYLFNQDILSIQESWLLKKLTDKKIITSSNGNYELYSMKKKNSALQASNITFQKINQVMYKVHLKNIKKDEQLKFLESYHRGWKLYQLDGSEASCLHKDAEITNTECQTKMHLFTNDELRLLFAKPLFDATHKPLPKQGNVWTINTNEKELDLLLYFQPQQYFYYGLLISGLSVLALGMISIKRKKI